MTGPYSNYRDPKWSAWAEQQPEPSLEYDGCMTNAELREEITLLCDGDYYRRWPYFTERDYMTVAEAQSVKWPKEKRMA